MTPLSDIAHLVELSVAPVFLLAGIGALLNVVTSRLGRVVDRARHLEDRFFKDPSEDELARIRTELRVLDTRMLYSQRAIFLFSMAALLVCIVVAALFIGGLTLFLLEITIATRTLRVRADLFAK